MLILFNNHVEFFKHGNIIALSHWGIKLNNECGSGGWIRTSDHLLNREPLYH